MVNGYASLNGVYSTDARFELDISILSGTTGSLNFVGSTNNLIASVG